MSKAPRDGVTVVIPAHNAAAALDQVLPAWGQVLTNLNRPFEIIVVNDGSTDNTAEVLEKRAGNVPHLRILKHDTQRGFGACLCTALAEAKQPLLMYSGVDYPYTPSDIRPMLERIELRDEVFGKQPDLISGARSGQERPPLVTWMGHVWKIFWRIFAGLPINESPPWYGWDEWWYRVRVSWVYGIPLADVNSAFKLYRTEFLKRFPIQSDGDFVHTELVAKATFLTSIMDEVPLTPKEVPLPALRLNADDERKVFRDPQFAMRKPTSQPTPPEAKSPEAKPPETNPPETNPPETNPPEAKPPEVSNTPTPAEAQAETNAGGLSSPGSPVPAT